MRRLAALTACAFLAASLSGCGVWSRLFGRPTPDVDNEPETETSLEDSIDAAMEHGDERQRALAVVDHALVTAWRLAQGGGDAELAELVEVFGPDFVPAASELVARDFALLGSRADEVDAVTALVTALLEGDWVAAPTHLPPAGAGARWERLVRLLCAETARPSGSARAADTMAMASCFGIDQTELDALIEGWRPAGDEAFGQGLAASDPYAVDSLLLGYVLRHAAGFGEDVVMMTLPGPEAVLAEELGPHLLGLREAQLMVQPPPAALVSDARLDVPAVLSPPDAPEDPLAASLTPHVLRVRADGYGVLALRRASAQASPTTLVDAWTPGASVDAPFAGIGSLAPDDLVDGRVAPLATQLEQGGACEPGAMSALVDRAVFFSTLALLMQTAREACGVDVRLHVRGPEDTLRTLGLRLAHDPSAEAHTVVVREDGYLLQRAASAGGARSAYLVAERGALARMLADVGTLYEGVAADDAIPLRLRVDDGSADFGLIAGLVDLLRWQRTVGDDTSERAVHTAPIVVRDGVPVARVPLPLEFTP